MGIYVKGLAMPQGCEECRFSTDDCYGCRATLSVIERENDEDRPRWCPLVELPTADELAEDMRTAAKNTDQEISHIIMDDVMCRILREIGYEEAVAIFEYTPKWYA